MDNQIRKTVMLRARIKPAEDALLRAVCFREGLTISEAVRQSIRVKAKVAGLYFIDGGVVEFPAHAEVLDGQPR